MPLQDDPEFDLDITIDIQPLVEELRGLREVALYTPLHTGAEFLIKLNRVTPHARGRPLPRGFARQIPTRRAGGQYYTVVLERAIQTKRNSWGQVWVARVSDPADSDSEQNDSDLPVLGHIVVKIVQPSLLPHPNPDSYHQWEYIPPKNVACTEDWMYGQLQALQGREVPCYYGMQTVVTPCGESAWLLAMEYVEGETLSRWLDSCHDDPGNWRRPNDLTPEVFDKFKQLLTSGIEGVMAIHAQSVFHGDVRRPNLIIAKAFPVGPRVVFIDLALGREIDDFPSAVDVLVLPGARDSDNCMGGKGPPAKWMGVWDRILVMAIDEDLNGSEAAHKRLECSLLRKDLVVFQINSESNGRLCSRSLPHSNYKPNSIQTMLHHTVPYHPTPRVRQARCKHPPNETLLSYPSLHAPQSTPIAHFTGGGRSGRGHETSPVV